MPWDAIRQFKFKCAWYLFHRHQNAVNGRYLIYKQKLLIETVGWMIDEGEL